MIVCPDFCGLGRPGPGEPLDCLISSHRPNWASLAQRGVGDACGSVTQAQKKIGIARIFDIAVSGALCAI